jgi:hypothetical protein
LSCPDLSKGELQIIVLLRHMSTEDNQDVARVEVNFMEKLTYPEKTLGFNADRNLNTDFIIHFNCLRQIQNKWSE